ncbi:MAG: nucleotide exchange factor GrpE [Candidatus Liptonbacteria bacterium]|nr:nucleotide exchange factor GrpE [Candidatus Liptonbacteria bacterium]
MDEHTNNQEPEKLLEGVDEAKELQERLAECEKERDEYLNGWRRAKADLANYKKAELERMEAVVKFGNEDILRDMLTIGDSFDLAIAAEPSDRSAGMRLIRSQMETILKRNGVEPIESTGTLFDPAFHESVGEMESAEPPGTVAETTERGWKLHGKVIRPSRVRIARNKNQEEGTRNQGT